MLCFDENLNLALMIEFKAWFLKPARALRNFKIYRATLVCHVNLDTAFTRLNFKIAQARSPRKFRYRFGTLKFKIARRGDKFNPQRALFRDFSGLAEKPIHLGDQNFLAVLRAVCELGEACLGGAHALTRIAGLCGVVLRIGGS